MKTKVLLLLLSCHTCSVCKTVEGFQIDNKTRGRGEKYYTIKTARTQPTISSGKFSPFLSPPSPVEPATSWLNKRKRYSSTYQQVSFLPSDFEGVQAPGKETQHEINDLAVKLDRELSPMEAAVTKFAMNSYIVSMCIALPLSLMPLALISTTNLLTKQEVEDSALQIGQFCARFLLRLMPFVDLKIIPSDADKTNKNPEPTIWVGNHVSAIDTFLWLAADKDLRGKNRRPLKTIYWKGLDENPVCRILFHMAGFIPVQMAANESGAPNEYDRASFKSMVKMSKQAFLDGFDILIFPEGQLNPNPEKGLLPVFPGAFALAKLSHRPIRFVAIHGSHRLWHADEDIGMTVTGRDVSIRMYPAADCGGKFDSKEEFVETFEHFVGHFGKTGEDPPGKITG